MLQQNSLAEDTARSFSEATGIAVQALGFDTEEAKGDLLIARQFDVQPDMILMPADFLGLYRELDLTPLDPAWLSIRPSEVIAGTGEVDGQRFGVPLISGNHLVLYFDRRRVEQPLTDFADFLIDLPEPDTPPLALNYREPYWFLPVYLALGGSLAPGDVGLDPAVMERALGVWQRLAAGGVLDPHCDYACTQGALAADRAPYSINGDWAFGSYRQRLGDQLGVAPLPAIDGRPLRPLVSSYVLALPALDRHGEDRRAAILALLDWFQRPEQQRAINRRYGLLPADQAALDAAIVDASGPERALYTQIFSGIVMPSDRTMAAIWAAVDRPLRQFLDGALSAADAAAAMQERAVRLRVLMEEAADD